MTAPLYSSAKNAFFFARVVDRRRSLYRKFEIQVAGVHTRIIGDDIATVFKTRVIGHILFHRGGRTEGIKKPVAHPHPVCGKRILAVNQ